MPPLSWCSASTSVSEGVFLIYPWKEMYSMASYLLLYQLVPPLFVAAIMTDVKCYLIVVLI